jgi:uncharacterized protein (DUF2235 family)
VLVSAEPSADKDRSSGFVAGCSADFRAVSTDVRLRTRLAGKTTCDGRRSEFDQHADQTDVKFRFRRGSGGELKGAIFCTAEIAASFARINRCLKWPPSLKRNRRSPGLAFRWACSGLMMSSRSLIPQRQRLRGV